MSKVLLRQSHPSDTISTRGDLERGTGKTGIGTVIVGTDNDCEDEKHKHIKK